MTKPEVSFPLQQQEPRPEAEIMQNWGDARQPVVSVCCATFNHVNYIEDAIRGFLAQETTFPFEIIIRDDASTDVECFVLALIAATAIVYLSRS